MSASFHASSTLTETLVVVLRQRRERQLSKRIEVLTKEAVARKKVGDIVGAKKRLVDRKRLSVQLERLISSISIIDMHINTIEGTELNKSILQTLKASADAMKKMGINSSGVEGVENIVQIGRAHV